MGEASARPCDSNVVRAPRILDRRRWKSLPLSVDQLETCCTIGRYDQCCMMDGFSNPVHLSYSIDHTGLSCSMSPVDLPTGAGSSTVSCQGSVGSYDVTVTGSSGSLTHSRHVTVTITTAQAESPGSPGIFGLAPMWFYGGIVALAIMLASILALRRRSKRNGKP